MSAMPLFDDPRPAPEPTPEPSVKHTEATMLERLRIRHNQTHGNGPRWVFATHVKDRAGAWHNRTADAVTVDLWPSKGNEMHGFEVKISRSDWLNEVRDPSKASAVKTYCDRWWLVIPTADMVRPGELPVDWGLLVCHGAGLRVAKAAPKLKATPATRSFMAALLRAAVKTERRRTT